MAATSAPRLSSNADRIATASDPIERASRRFLRYQEAAYSFPPSSCRRADRVLGRSVANFLR